MRRVTLSLDEKLADQFDQWAQRHSYDNRSEAFRDLLRDRMERERTGLYDEGHCVATVSYVYSHHERQLASRLAATLHERHHLSLATQYVQLDHDDRLETLILRGSTAEVRRFAESLIAERGVRHGQVRIIPVSVETETGSGRDHHHSHPYN